MSTQDSLRSQTCVLRVNLHCEGCKRKVKQLLLKIDGVYATSIDVVQGKVTVTGNVDPAQLIRKLEKAGKRAELWGPPEKLSGSLQSQLKTMQIDSAKGGKESKSQKCDNNQPKGSKKAQKEQVQVPKSKKDQKAVKSNLPKDDYFDGSEDDFNDFDEEELGDKHHHVNPDKMKPVSIKGNDTSVARVNGKDGKKCNGGLMALRVLLKGRDKKTSKKERAPKDDSKSTKDAKPKKGIEGDDKTRDKVSKHYGSRDTTDVGGGKGKKAGTMGHMVDRPMSQTGRIPSAAAMNPGYYQDPHMSMSNPYNQQCMPPGVMNQQKAHGNEMNQAMMCGRAGPAANCALPVPPPAPNAYDHYFSDENATGCSVM